MRPCSSWKSRLTIIVSYKPTLNFLTSPVYYSEAVHRRMLPLYLSKIGLRINEGSALQNSIIGRALDRFGLTAAGEPFNRIHCVPKFVFSPSEMMLVV